MHSNAAIKSTHMSKETTNFIQNISDEAIAVCKGTRLFASLMIAQAILESNWGKSKLSSLHHNYFGIKASKGWQGARATYKTTEYVKGQPTQLPQDFRSYPSLVAGFADRVKFLQVNPRYTINGVFTATTPEGQAKAFLKAGYATDPAYPQKLISIMNAHNLKQYDK
jgi:flagellum-specific peptidoglycan hydrolase FlgJ